MTDQLKRLAVTKRDVLKGLGAGAALGGFSSPVLGKPDGTRTAGPKGDGTGITPHSPGWTLTPAGDQVSLGDRPMGVARSPDGKHLAVSNDGQGTQTLMLLDTSSHEVVEKLTYPSPQALFVGVEFSPDGETLYASAGANNKVRVYDVSEGSLNETEPIRLGPSSTGDNVPEDAQDYFCAGLAVDPTGHRVFVANNLDNSVSVLNPRSREVLETIDVGNKPYTVALTKDGLKGYVSNWGENTVSVIDTGELQKTGTIEVGARPNDIAVNPTRPEIYVSSGDSDSVSIIDTTTDTATDVIDLEPYKNAPEGSLPDALTVSPDGNTLYVANAGNNDVAVVEIGADGRGKSRGKDLLAFWSKLGVELPEQAYDHHAPHVKGLIPTAWFPSALSLSPDGKTLFVANMKGLGAGPNKKGQYIGNFITGTLSIIDVPNHGQLKKYTRQVVKNNGFNEMHNQLTRGSSKTKPRPIPRRVDDPSPIEHVIYVIKENRTYDQVLGDIPEGNGDPSLTLFGEKVTPNHHRLAKEFVLLDNLYADAEVSADGHNWSMGAIANDYVQKTWPANYSGRGHPYDYENGGASRPGGNYLWNSAKQAGVSYRSYGEFARNITNDNGEFVKEVAGKDLPELKGHVDPNFPSFDLSITDQRRFREWQAEFQQFEKNGNLPELSIVRLPDDHTAGTSPGYPTPKSMVADNDLALGKLVETVTKSSYWKNTAIFVIEDDAQAGSDHVDAHRTVGLAISPYTKRGVVDSTFYSTVSMLRSIELILGMSPLSEFDARATPMINSFIGPGKKPDVGFQYNAITPDQPLDEMNTKKSPDAKLSQTLDLAKADEIPMQKFNHIIWHAVNGKDSKMPKPKTKFRSAPTPQALLAANSKDSDD